MTADLAEMGSLSFFNFRVKYLCVINVSTKYPWVKPMTDKKAKPVLDGFIGMTNISKLNLTYNEGKSVVAERFERTFKGKTYDKMTIHYNHSYLNYLDKLVYEYNNFYHHSNGKKPTDVDYSGLIKEFETNNKAPKFTVGNRKRITKHKKIFSKGYNKNWSRKILVIVTW